MVIEELGDQPLDRITQNREIDRPGVVDEVMAEMQMTAKPSLGI